jgi:hypothetical protein
MAVRLNRMHQDSVREKIKVGMIIDRLEKCAAGEIELTATQVQSARILLDKTISNATTDVNLSGEMSVNWPLAKRALDDGTL